LEAAEPATRSDDDTTDLDAAVFAAVAEGLENADRLVEKVTAVLDRCLKAGDDAGADHGDLPGRDVIAAYAALLTEKKIEAEIRFTRQRTRLATFNLVLFGRTGAGKSSLIEALSSGDGEPISQSESDWTTDVRDVHWHRSCLVDTPGIGGWGRTGSRAELEARAEAAVADADVVLLCFDTQSQQDGEFSKIAQWVSSYGKPVVAVLNSRNSRWRNPMRVGSQSGRRNLSQTVNEHVGHIRDELGLVGLPDVPVVVIHSKRAAFARTSDPYIGPDAPGRRKQRDEFGPERLLEWSNLPALELLLSEALERYAAPLRLGMLHEQARGLLNDAEAAVRTQRDEAAVLAEQLERGIADVLVLVGQPANKELAKRIKRLEKLRGGFGTAGASELLRHARHRLAAGLRNARMEAFRCADRLVEEAFEAREDLAPEVFDRAVLIQARTAAEAVARGVGGELQQYLSQRLDLVADDVQADLNAAISTFGGTNTTAGQAARTIGLALQTGSGLFTIGGSGVLLAAGLLNSWNPAGWILVAVAVGSAAGTIVLRFTGGKFRKKAATDRISALSDALSNGRRAVNDTFDHLERDISEDFSRILSQAAHERLADDVAQAMALRRVTRAASAATSELQKAIKHLPRVADASHLLSGVAVDLQRRHYPGEPTAGRLLWLGESWCTDPEGLVVTEAEPPKAVSHDPVRLELLLTRIRSVTEALGLIPASGAGTAWVNTTLDDLADDEDALNALAPVWTLVNGAPPRIVLAGDYSTGKSSFIKRLLVDSGLTVPHELEVAAQPKTATTEVVRWGDWELVDTPGFQSNHAEHAEAAHEAVVGASLLIILFNPNLVVGAASDLVAVLLGDRAAGRVGKLPRTLFVVNRSDELGIDPREDSAGYQNLCRRKELELEQALGVLLGQAGYEAGDVSAEQILCVASDPDGLVGDRNEVNRADYDQHRDWDGMDALGRALTGASVALGGNGLDIRILEGSAAILGDLIGTRQELLATLEAAIAQQGRLLLDLNACLSAGQALQVASRDRLETSFVGFVAKLFDDVAGAAHDLDALAARVNRLQEWTNDAGVQQLYREWAKRFARELKEWQEATTARIDARLASAAFVATFPDSGVVLDVDHLKPDEEPVVRDAAAGGAKQLGKYAAKAPRETVTRVAHAVGHKFKPWGATKLTAKVNTVGGAFGIAFGAVELYGIWRSTQKEGDAERTASERRGTCLRQVREAARDFFDSTEPDGPGISIGESLGQVQRARDEVAGGLHDTQAEAAALTRKIDRCEQRMRDALERLETPSHDR
jgi:predicted GTPase